MRLTRLEIFGFKSFVDRFVLNFDRNMIGVVGPNGCGKSNIVDSLRWVLGETHAKQLRGGILEDLIFNGSDSRRPLGMAEVSITIRPHEGWAPSTVLHLQELARSDNGEIQNQDESSEETSEIQETSITSTRANTATTLLQLPGLFDAAEVQLTRRLYRSGESEYFINRVPCRLRDMIEFYRIIGLGSRGLSIVQQGQVGDIVTRKPEELRELLEEAAGISGFRSRIDAAERRLEKTIENLSRLRDLSSEIEKQVRSLGRQAKRARERGALREELRGKELELHQLKGALIVRRQENAIRDLEEGEARLTELRSETESLSEQIKLERERTADSDNGLAELRSKREALLAEVRKRQAEEQELRLLLSRIESRGRGNRFQLSELGDYELRLEKELETLNRQLAESEAGLSELKEKKLAAEAELSATVGKNAGELSDELSSLAKQIAEKKAAISEERTVIESISRLEEELRILFRHERELDGDLSKKRTQLAHVEAEQGAIDSQLRELARAVEEELSGGEQLGEVLLRGITAPEGFEHALLAVLGERGRYLVTENADELLGKFEETKAKRQSIGVISATAALKKGLPHSEKLLVNSLKIEPWAERAANSILTSIYVVDDVLEGRALRRELGEEITIVTKNGVVLAPWGWFATGDSGIRSFRLTRLLDEKKLLAGQLSEELGALEESRTKLRQSVEAKHQEKDELRAMLSQLQILGREVRDLENKERELEKRELNARLQEERHAQNVLREASTQLSSAERGVQHLIETKMSRLREKDRTSDRAKGIADEWTEIELEYRSARERVLAEAKTELFASLEEFLEQPHFELNLQFDSPVEEELLKVEGLLSEGESALRKARFLLSEIGEARDSKLRETETLNNSLQELRIKGERSKVELELLRDEVREKFGPDFEFSLQEGFSDEELHQLENRHQILADKVRLLRQRYEADGEVDPSVIDEYEKERVRLAELESQIEDLAGAERSIERMIKHLRELSKKRFIETYEDVSHRFEALIPRLFGGGSGKMELSLPDDPLATGVIITVRPPGKKLRSLDLLSGGEKALTATAILLAMFLHRPSPICVLDEVDAPLDDANLERFLNLIKEISEKTQMLVITHNKQSMLASDRLIGITMQEAGVSKALSVTFDEAVEELERMAVNG